MIYSTIFRFTNAQCTLTRSRYIVHINVHCMCKKIVSRYKYCSCGFLLVEEQRDGKKAQKKYLSKLPAACSLYLEIVSMCAHFSSSRFSELHMKVSLSHFSYITRMRALILPIERVERNKRTEKERYVCDTYYYYYYCSSHVYHMLACTYMNFTCKHW